MNTLKTFALSALISLFAISCGSDGFNVPESTATISQAQAESLSKRFIENIPDTIYDEISIDGNDFSGSFSESEKFDFDYACNEGTLPITGTVRAQGKSANNKFTATANLEGRSNISQPDCKVNSLGDLIDLSAVDVTWKTQEYVEFSIVDFSSLVRSKTTSRGAIDVGGDNVEVPGTCGIDLTWEAEETDNSETSKLTGTFCGLDIDLDL